MWVEIRIFPLQISHFKTPNSLFRRMSKSSRKLGAVKNKDFWKKSVVGGYYRCNVINRQVEYVFYLKLNEFIDNRRFQLELRIRLGIMGISKIEFSKIEEPIFVFQNQNFFKKFGIFYLYQN
jgi:hypothetical protein